MNKKMLLIPLLSLSLCSCDSGILKTPLQWCVDTVYGVSGFSEFYYTYNEICFDNVEINRKEERSSYYGYLITTYEKYSITEWWTTIECKTHKAKYYESDILEITYKIVDTKVAI